MKRLAGLIFVCLADEPPEDFEDMAQRMTPYLAPHALTHTKVAHQVDVIEQGNWKLTIENNRECFHCAGHPELLNSLFDFFGDIDAQASVSAGTRALLPLPGRPPGVGALWQRFGLPWQPIEELRGRPTGFRTERLVLDGAGESMTPDTRAASRRLLGEFTEARLGSLHFHVQPNAWFHFLADHVLTFATLPLDARYARWCAAPGSCTREAVEGVDYDLENLTQRLERHQCAGRRFRRRDAARRLEPCRTCQARSGGTSTW